MWVIGDWSARGRGSARARGRRRRRCRARAEVEVEAEVRGMNERPAVLKRPSVAACRGHNAVQPQVLDNLAVVVKAMAYDQNGHPEPGRCS
jgi:hypothetical protein